MLTLVTTGAPETARVPEEPPSPRSGAPALGAGRARALTVVAWLVTPTLALALGVALEAADREPAEGLGGASARYLPAEGDRTTALDADGRLIVTEHARSTGIEALLTAPTLVASSLLGALGEEDAMRAQWWRAERVEEDGARSTSLHRLSPDGVALAAVWGGELGFVFEPHLPLLPAGVRPGSAWSASGTALPGEALAYAAEFSAWSPAEPPLDAAGDPIPLTGGCLGVDARLRISQPGGGFERRIDESTVWCPGRGAVWSSATVDGIAVGFTEQRQARLVAARAPSAAAPSWRDVVEQDARLGVGGQLERIVQDPFFGAAATDGQYSVRPAVTADGRLVVANDRGDDLEVWSLAATTAELAWSAHPGGTIVAVGSAGGLVLAATSLRRIVAYDPLGRRLWSTPTDELVLAAPVAVDDGSGDVVALTRAGSVVRIAAADGGEVWRTSLGGDGRGELAVADGQVLASDERGRVSALRLADGALQWRSEPGLVDALAADAESGVVAVATDDGAVVLLGLERGEERGGTRMPGIATGIVVAGDAVVALTDERLLVLDADDLAVRWSGEGGVALLGEGEAVAVVGAADVVLRSSADGAERGRRELPAEALAESRAAVAVGAAVVALDTDGGLHRWELE